MTSTSDEKNLYKFHFSFHNCQKSASNRKFYINQLTQYVYTDREAATALKRAFAAYRPAPPLPFCPSPPTAQTDLPTQTAEPKKTDRQQKIKAALLQTGRLSKEKAGKDSDSIEEPVQDKRTEAKACDFKLHLLGIKRTGRGSSSPPRKYWSELKIRYSRKVA